MFYYIYKLEAINYGGQNSAFGAWILISIFLWINAVTIIRTFYIIINSIYINAFLCYLAGFFIFVYNYIYFIQKHNTNRIVENYTTMNHGGIFFIFLKVALYVVITLMLFMFVMLYRH